MNTQNYKSLVLYQMLVILKLHRILLAPGFTYCIRLPLLKPAHTKKKKDNLIFKYFYFDFFNVNIRLSVMGFHI